MMDDLLRPHHILTWLTAWSWVVVSVTAALAALYGGPRGTLYENIVDKRRWWRRGLCVLLCFATAARALTVIDGSKPTTWDDITIATVLATFAVFYWHRYINERREPDARDGH